MNYDQYKEFPEFNSIVNRGLRLAELEQQIRDEQDPEQKELMYDTYLALSKLNYEKLMEHSTNEIMKGVALNESVIKNAKTFERQCQQLADKLNEEREANKKFYDEFVFCMLTDPKYTVESALMHVERGEKIKDQSGKAWVWILRFHLLARIRMAYRLIFGARDEAIKACLENKNPA